MKRYFYVFVLLLLLILPVSGQRQRSESWRNACMENCKAKYNVCLQQSQGDGPKKEACERNYRSCRYWCAHPARRA